MEEDGPLGPSSVDTEEHQPFGSTATHRDIQCGSTQCTLTISAGGYRSLDGTATSVSPGSRICLATGQMTGLVLKNLHGTAAQPIEVVNCNGEVLIAPTATVTSNGFVVEGSSHLKITGTGHTGSTYGIKISQTKSQGLYLTSLSTNIEVDHLEISQTGFAGIMAKTDPKCDGYGTRGTFTMRGIHIHDNKIHHTRGEGLYIGSTNYNSGISCTGGQKYPHDLIGVRIYRNHIHDTDSDGFQVGCAIQDVEVYDNLVEDYALKPFDLYQDNGIQIGDGTTGKWFNNVIRRGPGNAFIVKGLGNISVFNNLAEDTAGIYVHNAIPANAEVALLNNTFIKTKARGIEVAEPDAPVKVHNNIMVPLAGVTPLKKSAKTVESHNLFNQDINYFAFVNAAAGDYHLTAGSPARNAGLNVSTYLTFDWEYEARNDGAYDIGADEYVASGNTVFSQDFQSSTTVGAYVNATSPGVGQFNDISAEATGGSWSINGGRLQLVRTGSSATDNDAGVTRWTDFAGPPTVLHVSFDVGVSAWTLSQYQTNALCMDVGRFSGLFDYNSAGPLGDVFSSLCISGKGPGVFAFVLGGTESIHYNANGTMYRVSWFLNRSGAAASYRAPDGTTRTLQPNHVSAWVGTTLLVNDVAAANGSTSDLTDLRLRWSNADNGTWTFDNFVLKNALPQ